MKRGLLILAGGKASRFNGINKAHLKLSQEYFIERLKRQLPDFDGFYLAVGKRQDLHLDGFINVYDNYEDIGPMAGIEATMKVCKEDVLFVVSCDMPLVDQAFSDALFMKMEDHLAAFYENDEHLFMTCGYYSIKLLPEITKAIQEKNYRLYRIIKENNPIFIKIGEDMRLSNINTKADYEALLKKQEG